MHARLNALEVHRHQLAHRHGSPLAVGTHLAPGTPPHIQREWEHLAAEIQRLERELLLLSAGTQS